jgi:hypothetical protein
MLEKTEHLKKSKDSFFDYKIILRTFKESFFDHKATLRIVIFIFGIKILKALGLPFSIALLLSGTISILVDYWIPPRPKESFSRHFIVDGSILLGIILAITVIPPYLRPFMPTWLAYFLPIILLSVPSYFLLKIGLPEPGFLRWVFGCTLFAVILSAIFQYIDLHG